MRAATGWTVFLAILVAGLGFAYYVWQEDPVRAPPVLQPSARAAPGEGLGEGEIRFPHFPIEQVRPPAEAELPAEDKVELLPALAESDDVAAQALATLVAESPLRDLLQIKTFIRRIVITVDNLPREKVARRMVPVKSAEGSFLVVEDGEALVISEDNQARYAPYVRLAEAVDAARLTAVYARLYPLFQEAYQELGYPQGHFNDRLVQVIDHLLAAPRVEGPLRVVQPKVMYEFADPALAGLSAGQHVMVRMGSANADRVKAKLREIRVYLTGGRPEPGRPGG